MKKFYSYLLTIILISIHLDAKSQNWINYTPANSGLITYTVNVIYIDTFGVKWFGTPLGVSKFDGTNWTSYTTANGLVNNDVREIMQDHYGNMWFGTLGGISKFDGTNWSNFTKTVNNLPSQDIRAIAEDKYGDILCGGYDEGGIKKYNGLFWETVNYYICPKVCKIQLDTAHNINVGGFTESSVNINNSWQVMLTTNFGLKTMAIDKNNDKYFLTVNPPLKILSGSTFTDVNLPNNASANAVCFDNNGNTWYGTSNYIIKSNSGFFTVYDNSNGVTNQVINAIACEGNSKIWAGGIGGVYEFVCTNSAPISIGSINTTNGNIVSKGQNNVSYTVQSNPKADFYKWQYTGSGVKIFYNSNLITIDFSDSATSGDLKVQIFDSCGNSSPLSILPISVQGFVNMNEYENSTYKIFPNPVESELSIISNSNENVEVFLYDLSGRILIKSNEVAKNISLNISHLESGQYFLRIIDSNKTLSYKILKK